MTVNKEELEIIECIRRLPDNVLKEAISYLTNFDKTSSDETSDNIKNAAR